MITIKDIREYQKKLEVVKANGFKGSDFIALGVELRDKFNLTDMEALAILNNKESRILALLERQEKENEQK